MDKQEKNPINQVIKALNGMSLSELERVKDALIKRERYFQEFQDGALRETVKDFETKGHTNNKGVGMRNYVAVIEKCPETGFYVGFVPGFPGAHTQAKTLGELHQNLKEVIGMLLEDGEPVLEGEFIGTQSIAFP